MLGQLARSSDRIVPLAFHVDYFNKPWKDPFSDPLYSQREWRYSALYDKKYKLNKPDYLYLTPLIMVGGQVPMVGSNKDAAGKAKSAISRALSQPAEFGLRLRLEDGKGERDKVLQISVGALSSRAVGKEVLVGIATYEDQLSTDVKSGELEGKTYVGRYVVRRFQVEAVTPQRGRAATLRVPITLDPSWKIENCGVAVFLQDEWAATVHQAESLRWAVAADGKPIDAASAK